MADARCDLDISNFRPEPVASARAPSRSPVRRVRRRLLACVIAAGLGLATTDRHAAAGAPAVTNCDDAGPGSLRAALTDASDGDHIDLGSLACDTISLVTGEIGIVADDLQIDGDVTISGGGLQRIFAHHGNGTLSISGLTLEDGRAWNGLIELGGCIYSSGSVDLDGVTLRGCVTATAPASFAWARSAGGGVYALHALNIENSLITGCISQISYGYSYAYGGGVAAGGDITLRYSTLDGNATTTREPFAVLLGGGSAINASGALRAYSSTISGNGVERVPSIVSGDAFGAVTTSQLQDVTISGNTGGVFSGDTELRIWNSTIVFNTTTGVYASNDDAQLDLRGSIIAGNVSRFDNSADDVHLDYGSDRPIAGSANLIQHANVPPPPDTIAADPLLGALADNGGPTKTHALLAGSPAIDHGISLGESFDQRGPGYPRVVGGRADIGAYELSLGDQLLENGFD